MDPVTKRARRSYSTLEVGKILGVWYSTVIYWCNKGWVKHTRTIGGHRRISRAEVKRLARRLKLTYG